MQSRNKKGFGAIELLITVVILLVIGGLAWYALAGKPKPTPSVSPTPSASISTSPTTSPSSDANSLSVTEYGVKLSLSRDILDLSYYYSATDPTYVTLTSAKLKALDQKCSDSGHLVKASAADKANLQTGGITVGDSYYYIALPNGLCTDKPTAIAQDAKVRDALKSAVLEKL